MYSSPREATGHSSTNNSDSSQNIVCQSCSPHQQWCPLDTMIHHASNSKRGVVDSQTNTRWCWVNMPTCSKKYTTTGEGMHNAVFTYLSLSLINTDAWTSRISTLYLVSMNSQELSASGLVYRHALHIDMRNLGCSASRIYFKVDKQKTGTACHGKLILMIIMHSVWTFGGSKLHDTMQETCPLLQHGQMTRPQTLLSPASEGSKRLVPESPRQQEPRTTH